MKKILIFLILIGFLVNFTPLAYSQSVSGLYEGFYVEYEEVREMTSCIPVHCSYLAGFVERLFEKTTNSEFHNLQIYVDSVSNDKVTLTFTTPEEVYTKLFTYSELSDPTIFPMYVSNPNIAFPVDPPSSFGDEEFTNYKYTGVKSIKIGGEERLVHEFASELTFVDDILKVEIRSVFIYDQETGFYLGDMLYDTLYDSDEFAGSIVDGVQAKEIGSNIPIPIPVVEPKICPEGYTRLGDYCKSPNADVMSIIVLAVIISAIAGVIFFLKKRKGGSKTQQYASAISSDSKFCYNCQTPALANNKFCKKCGKPI